MRQKKREYIKVTLELRIAGVEGENRRKWGEWKEMVVEKKDWGTLYLDGSGATGSGEYRQISPACRFLIIFV